MTSSGWAPLVGLAVVATILSGCLSEGELSLDGLQAPVWEPGYRWSYDVDATGTHTYLSDGSRATQTFEYATGLNSTVINTSGSIDDAPVYFLTQDTAMDDDFYGLEMGLFGGGGVVALTQDTLQPVARSSFWEWKEGCGPVQMYPVEEPSLLEFPLNLGKTWSGDLHRDVAYEAEVIGVEPVATGAGTFDTVHVKVVLTPLEPSEPDVVYEASPDYDPPAEPPTEERESIEEAEFTQEYWYAPAVRNVIKTVTTGHTVYTEGTERYEMSTSTTIVLTDFSLIPGEEQPAPTLVRHDRMFRQDSLRIVTDTAFPHNVANGTTTARFGVETAVPEPIVIEAVAVDGPHPAMEAVRLVERSHEMKLVEAVPDVSDYDHEAYELHWWAYTSGGEHREFVGDVLELELDGPQYVDINAHLRPVERAMEDDCHRFSPMMWTMPAQGHAVVFFEKVYSFGVAAGPAHELELDALPIAGGDAVLAGEWTIESAAPLVSDRPNVVVYGPDGNAYPGESDHGFIEAWLDGHAGDGWRLVWQADGPDAAIGPAPAVVGHDATLKVRIDPQ